MVANGLKILAVAIYLCRRVLVERPQPHRGSGRLGLLLRWATFLASSELTPAVGDRLRFLCVWGLLLASWCERRLLGAYSEAY